MTPIALRRIRWAIAGALLALLLAVCATAPRCATGATWQRFTFGAPADSGIRIDRYRMEWKRSDGVWDSARIYRTPGVEGVPVRLAGEPCTLFVSQTVAPLTSRTWRIVSVNMNGVRAGASNLCVVATGFPDTLVCLSRPILGDFEFRRFGAGPSVTWDLAYGDSADIRAMHQEELQRLFAPRLCQIFGHWALKGVQAVCP